MNDIDILRAVYVYGNPNVNLLHHRISINHRPASQLLQAPLNELEDKQIFIGPKLTDKEMYEIMSVLRFLDNSYQKAYINASFEAWRDQRIRGFILGLPSNIPIAEVRVVDVDSVSEAILARDEDNEMRWRSTYTSHVDTFCVDMALMLPGLEVVDLQACFFPGAFDEQFLAVAQEKFFEFFESNYYVTCTAFRKLALPLDIISILPEVIELARYNPFFGSLQLYPSVLGPDDLIQEAIVEAVSRAPSLKELVIPFNWLTVQMFGALVSRTNLLITG